MVLDLLKARLEQPANLVMAPLKFREHLAQKAVDLRFRQRHQASHGAAVGREHRVGRILLPRLGLPADDLGVEAGCGLGVRGHELVPDETAAMRWIGHHRYLMRVTTPRGFASISGRRAGLHLTARHQTAG